MIGEIIAGKYRVDSEIGVGGMGCVYRAHTLGAPPRHVAIKMLRPEVADSEMYEQRFAAEVGVTSALVHENIVRVDDHGHLPDGRQFLVLELLVGQSLAEVMERCDHLKWDRALRIARDCALALDVVHSQDVVHRDLKPENIFLQPGVGHEHVKLMDFGLAKCLRESDDPTRILTEPGFAIGTPTYMAPERVTGDYDCRSDLYALCVVLYEMVSGVPPFSGKAEDVLRKHLLREPRPVSRANPKAAIPRSVEIILQKGLAKHVGARFQSAKELVEELSMALVGESDATVAVARAPQWSWKRRLRHFLASRVATRSFRRIAMVSGAVLMLALLVSIGTDGDSAASAGDSVFGSMAKQVTSTAAPEVVEGELQLSQGESLEMQVARASWSERSIEVKDFTIERSFGDAPCGKGLADGINLMLCIYESEDSAASAQVRAAEALESETSVALASGNSLLLLAADGQDPEGRKIQAIIEGFLARHDE